MKQLIKLFKYWKEFSNVPVNECDEIEESFLHFDIGTDRIDVLKWFDEQHPDFRVAEFLNANVQPKNKLIAKSTVTDVNDITLVYDYITRDYKVTYDTESNQRFTTIDAAFEYYLSLVSKQYDDYR